MPSWARVKVEAVARGFRRADAPARCRGACLQRWRRTQQEKRQARIAGGEMQPLAQFQIELVDHPGDGGRRGRMQCLGHGPQGLLAVRRLDQDQARRIETEAADAMSGKTAVSTPCVVGHDHDDRIDPRQAGKNRHDETEGGGTRTFALGHDFMQRACGQAAFRQAGIECGEPEGQGFAYALISRQQPAQFRHHGGTLARHGKDSAFNHLCQSGCGQSCRYSWYVLGPYPRTNREHCQEPRREQEARAKKANGTRGRASYRPTHWPRRAAAARSASRCFSGLAA
jgi:hypothetical protein